MPKIDVYDVNGKKVKELELNESVFGIEPNENVVHSVVVNYLANQRQGTQNTKTRAEVSGGGRKPWRQKGTGRARQGSIRAPQWIKGGIALGPRPRSYVYKVNKKERALAVRSVLSAKVQEQELVVVDKLSLKEIKTADLANFIKEQTGKMNDDHDKLIEKTNENKEKLLKEREEISKLNEIYLNQEKQIAMFLNCRKSFFKKLRYYFTDTKHEKKSFKSKKKPAKDDGKQELEKKVEKTLNNSISAYKPTTSAYTISDLMKACSETNSAEEEYINSQSDLNAAILKHKNMKLKVHNADKYIEEIEEHKKSIFEFWKFTNKDELPALKEGETIQKDQKIKAVFNYDEDIIELGEKADRLQRQKLSNDECNSICASLQVVNSINSVIDNKEELLKQDLKRLQDEYTGDIKTEIFGEIKDDYTVVKKLNNKQHRENKRNIYSILRINSQTTIEDYRNTIEDYARLLNESYNKIVAITDFPVYYLKSKETKENDYIIADINPDNIINIAQSGDTIVKRNIRKDEHIIYASNIIFYDNYNKTLPVGMNVSTLVIIKDEEKKQKCSNINIVEENDEFSIKIKKLNIIELE